MSLRTALKLLSTLHPKIEPKRFLHTTTKDQGKTPITQKKRDSNNTVEMSESINTNQPMDTEPGGENPNQYESQKTFTQPAAHPNPLSQFRDPETGTVHLPTHRKMHPADIKARAAQHSDTTTPSTSNEGGDGAHLPTHNKVHPSDIQARARSAKAAEGTEGIGNVGAGKGGVSKERGEKTAENIRYGEAISEHGFGGETVGNRGSVGTGKEGGEGEEMRGKMGYGGGSGVGA